MTIVEVNFLTGRYRATAHHSRDQAEWPPHPARLFSALVAAWADGDPPDEAERTALEWLESQSAPRISASAADERRVVSYYVPINDVRVVGPSAYQRRADRIDELTAELEDHLETTGGEVTKPVERLIIKIDKQRDITQIVKPGSSQNTKPALELLPEGRSKKERYFPSVTPLNPRVTFEWPKNAPPEVSDALDGLLARVTRLGHSASLVSCRMSRQSSPATYVPGADTEGPTILRWVQPGQMQALEDLYQQHRGIRPRPLPFRGIRYRSVEHDNDDDGSRIYRPNTAGWWVIFEVEAKYRKLSLTRTAEVTEALRGAVLRHAQDPLPEGLSGHLADGRPTRRPHVAFVALPNVCHEHADGRIMGLAVSLPDDLDEAARQVTLHAIGKWEERAQHDSLRLTFGRGGLIRIRRKQPPFALVNLRPSVWKRSSRRWVSVTPIALPNHPGRLSQGTARARAKAWARAETAVLRAVGHVNLPEPSEVAVSLTPFITGTRPTYHFPALRQGNGPKGGTVRCLVHVSVRFNEPVAGPFMLGSGRFAGLGLMRPVNFKEKQSDTRKAVTDE